jgi:hypothetical protein
VERRAAIGLSCVDIGLLFEQRMQRFVVAMLDCIGNLSAGNAAS